MASWAKVRVAVRAARPEDGAAREQLLRQALASHHTDAFLHFFFQELTLQCVVLCGAVLFIFMGAPVWACAALVPAAAALVAVAVRRMRGETSGWVAEATGPLGAPPPAGPLVVTVGALPQRDEGAVHRRVVGTASASEYWGAGNSAWLHGVAVEARWRRRGVGRALVGAARAWAAGAGLESVEAAASAVGGGGGRALLHACGWALRQSYHRPLLGAALTLPMAQLGVDLPQA
ncbi:hypothetical protein K1T71_013432 [Dendrolimus kikuchii]|uniref:Uncharacterized protein n=1 Tax=Dendrolimus kikuchii TaxID=765133 RepID=A0ACC1CGD0_9NEOP|nr:hypothetical protein K1T71_013432 [Dendrolimus kikuchii]